MQINKRLKIFLNPVNNSWLFTRVVVSTIVALFIMRIGAPLALAAEEPVLKIGEGASVKVFSLSDLKRKTKLTEVTVFNHSIEKNVTYEGFWLESVLSAAGIDPDPELDSIVFHCQDGYTTSLSAGEMGEKQWLVSFGEKGDDWTLLVVDGKTVSPAPWYVVGTQPSSFEKFPWPYQVVSIMVQKGSW